MRLIDAEFEENHYASMLLNPTPDVTEQDKRNARIIIDALRMAKTVEPKRGKWIRDGHHIRCDQCGMYMCDTDREGDRIPTEFCPNCGAKMEVTE